MALATLKVTKITGRLAEISADGSVDPDETPDELYCDGGTVTFTPSVSEVTLTAEVPAVKARVRPITGTIDAQGYLTINGVRRLYLSSSTNPGKIGKEGFRTGWTWRVDFAATRAGVPVPFDSFDFVADADSDLAKLTPVNVAPLVITLKGEPGTIGGGGGDGTVTTINAVAPGVDGNLTLTLDDVPAGTVAKPFTASLLSKLNGIETGANLATDAEITALANDAITAATGILRTTGAQTVAGVKTFSSAPVVPANAFPTTAINGLAQFIRDTVEAAYGRIVVARGYTGAAWETEAVASDVEAYVLWNDQAHPTTTNPPARSSDPEQQVWFRQ